MRLKCKCGYRTFSKRRLKRHQRNCEVFKDERQSKARPSEGQEIEKELDETPSSEKTIAELREEAKAKGMTGIYSLNKQALVDRLKE